MPNYRTTHKRRISVEGLGKLEDIDFQNVFNDDLHDNDLHNYNVLHVEGRNTKQKYYQDKILTNPEKLAKLRQYTSRYKKIKRNDAEWVEKQRKADRERKRKKKQQSVQSSSN